MAQKGILVTGGTGYIGSHTARQLGENGERLVTLDNLCTGFRQAGIHGELIVDNTGDQGLVSRILKEHDIDTVKRVFDLVKDFGTSQSSKIDSIFDSLLCPDR
ncbi:MAG: NAD-dependent epimerase/dehydratase family protein, partial [Candidatus Thiodiazotropha sp. (ex Lucinoma aequizonata)]|nr:NAD-dependent epimerase/dehydratase family protein [Candidatus Thiodiazotropha sp. (ex Lucinoma aequizonata)]